MYKEDIKKMTVKRLKSAGVKVSARNILRVEVAGVTNCGHKYGYPATHYKVMLKNGSRVLYTWRPINSASDNYMCEICR